MSENPYLPPSSDLGDGGQRAMSRGSGSFEVGRCLSDAWAATWANFPVWLGVFVVGALLGLLAALTVIGYFVVAPVLLWGWVRYVLRAHDGGARFGDLFAGFSRYGAALVPTLVCLLLIGLAGLLAQSLQLYGDLTQNTLLSRIGIIVMLAYSFAIAPRLNLAYFYIVDQGCGALEALGQAWNDTRALQLQVAVLMLLSVAILFAGVLVLLVGVIPASMMVQLMWVSAYRQYGGAPAPA